MDDTSNGCNDAHLEEPMPYAELIAMAQVCAQIWEQLLFSSGGALKLKKCFWYLIYWQWVNGHLQMTTISECPGIIALTCGTVPNYTVIPRLKVWETNEHLECTQLRMVIIERRLSSYSSKPTITQCNSLHRI